MINILIVEDHLVFRQDFKQFLLSQFSPITISEAANSDEALAKINSIVPHIIFMDIGLPGISGITLTRRIKAMYPEKKIIILTNYDIPEYRKAAFDAGANDFLLKGSASQQQISILLESILSANEMSI